MTGQPTLQGQVKRGVLWSSISNTLLRLSGMLVGIVLAWLLTPEEFGVYAIALTVQGILMALADFGLSADLIRAKDPRRRAPTVATLGLVTGTALAALMALGAPAISTLLGSSAAAPAVALLSVTLLLGGAGVVPFAMLQRRFNQKALFYVGIADFVVGTTVTLALIAAGWGVMALATGRVVAQVVSMLLQFRLARERPHYGFDRHEAASVLRFGVPVSSANVLSWALLGADKVVIGIIAGPVALGLYVLAFNISAWPMTAVGQVVRSVAVPMFSRTAGLPGDRSLSTATALTWALALPIGAGLAAVASPLIAVVYGEKWAGAAAVLAVLAMFGALRAVFDVAVAYLLAHGASGAILVVQVVWLAALLPALVLATTWWGIVGAAWAHVAVSIAIAGPGYLIALHKAGAELGPFLGALWPPVLAVIPAIAGAVTLGFLIDAAWLHLLAAAAFGALAYSAALYRWVRRRLSRLKELDTPATAEVAIA